MRKCSRDSIIFLGIACALGAPALAGAQDLDFNYVEGGLIAGFVNDVEDSGTITGTDGTLELETDAGAGAFIAGAWQFGEHMHVFGEYSSSSQDLEVRDGGTTVEGDYDVVRWRIGVGYAHPVSPELTWYGRVSLDHTEFQDVSVAGFNLDADADDDGFGGELGVLWAATPRFHLQGHVRYTSVGEVAPDDTDTFDDDILIGVNGRWHFRPQLAVVTGYEFGNITSWNLGLRYSF